MLEIPKSVGPFNSSRPRVFKKGAQRGYDYSRVINPLIRVAVDSLNEQDNSRTDKPIIMGNIEQIGHLAGKFPYMMLSKHDPLGLQYNETNGC